MYSPMIPRLIMMKLPMMRSVVMRVANPETDRPRDQDQRASLPTVKPSTSVARPSTVMIRSGRLVKEVSAVMDSSISDRSDHLLRSPSRALTSKGRRA